MFRETPIEVLEEEGLAGLLEDALEAIEADDEAEADETESEESEEEKESWIGEAWETAEQVVKEGAEKIGGKVAGRWTGPEEWKRTAKGGKDDDTRTCEERMPEGESEVGSQTGWEVGEARKGETEAGWLD